MDVAGSSIHTTNLSPQEKGEGDWIGNSDGCCIWRATLQVRASVSQHAAPRPTHPHTTDSLPLRSNQAVAEQCKVLISTATRRCQAARRNMKPLA